MSIKDTIYTEKTTKQYLDTVGYDVANEETRGEEENLLHSLIPKDLENKRVLDLGCGNGRYSELFCNNDAKKVVALDVSESMYAQAESRKSNKQLNQLELVCADMNEYEYGKNTFDFIFSRFSLVHTEKMAQVVKKLGEALSTEGEILIATNVVKILKNSIRLDFLKEPIPIIITIDNKQVKLNDYAYTSDEYIDALEKAGLVIEVFEKFPVKDLIINPEFPNHNAISFSYGIFKAKKLS